MRKIKTASSAPSVRSLKRTAKTTTEVANRRLPARTVQNIKHAHMLKGIREIARMGWQSWEPDVAIALRNLERQRFEKANRYYDAVERIQALLEAVRRRREQAEEAAARLEQTSSYLQTVMDTMVDLLVITDGSGRITDVNRAMEITSGFPRDQIVGRHFDTLFADTARAREELGAVLDEGRTGNFELVLKTRGGQDIPLSANATLLLGEGGADRQVVVSARDITDVKNAEVTLTEQASELARSNAELEQFAYVASHDLQEPLRKIRTFADVLKDMLPADVMGPEARDFMERMQDAAARMQTLISDLLSFSRITTRAQPHQKVSLNEVVEDVLSDLEVAIGEAGATVDVGELPEIEAEPTHMRQLLQNLIANAIKFRKAGVPPRVSVFERPTRAADLPRGLPYPPRAFRTLVVADNGIGFDPKYAERIFTVFQRLHGRDEYPGTGIGLAVCRKIADLHGGQITATSKPGEGSEFIITLPLRQSGKDDDRAE